MEIRAGRNRGRWWFWACPALAEGGDKAEGMRCFSAVLIFHFFSVPFIQLHQAVAGLPWCCKSPLLRWLLKVLSVKDVLQSWSPLAKRGVDLCSDLPGVLVGLGTSEELNCLLSLPSALPHLRSDAPFLLLSLHVFFFSLLLYAHCPEACLAPRSHPWGPAQTFPGSVAGILREGQGRQVCASGSEAAPLAGLGETLREEKDGCAGSALPP